MRQGQMLEAQADLYADEIVCIEPEGAMAPHYTKGKEAVLEKGKQFVAMIEQRHGGSCSDPIIAGEFFSLTMLLDVTMKGMGRITFDEICVYRVKNGKIVFEQFFFNTGSN
jgi:hypothetical protein